MLRSPPFSYRAPTTTLEAARILRGEGERAMLLAGGTDLLPNLKRRQQTPAVLVALRGVAALRAVTVDDEGARIGGGAILARLAADPRLAPWGALTRAAASVASPPIRNQATIGGNLCLDTRCNYYNQSYEWRQAIGFCMKRGAAGGGWPARHDEQVCWVAPSSPRCWAVSSTDTAPALCALGATVTLASADGEREAPLGHLYRDDGIDYLGKRRDEILTAIRLPDPRGLRSTYWKLRRRSAFDFPVLGVGAAVRLDDGGGIAELGLFLGAVASYPLEVDTAFALGRRLDDATIAELADRAGRLAKPLDNTDFALGWRKRVARHYVEGALKELRGDDPATLGLLARRATALRPL